MTSQRASGVLLHPTSLPGGYGIGSLGPGAIAFIVWLARPGQRLWQVLPLGPTGYGDSPYQCFSAFAGNPLLVSLERLIDEGLLSAAEAGDPDAFRVDAVDFPAVIAHRQRLWPAVLERFDRAGASPMARQFDRFCAAHADWLDDFALFMAVKEAHDHQAWTAWEPGIAQRDPVAMARWSARCATEIRRHKLTQFLFFEQWDRVREAARARSIAVMGDLPIFVAHDSADVWAHRDLFRLDPDGHPNVLTGVPPDYFSATGQLWGNPHYRWDRLRASGYAWWIRRFQALLAMVDAVRIDHFRGFEASWEVPRGASTAIDGAWVEGPGLSMFDAVQAALGTERLPFVAENLGVITPAVEALRRRLGLPGMAILQFAFGTDPQAPDFTPYNYPRDLVVYTGTHDNDTTVGWWTGGIGHSTRSNADREAEREAARRYLDLDGREVHWQFIRAVLGSVAHTAIIPMQDGLGLGSDARMNQPGTADGNWRWRLAPDQATPALAARLGELAATYGRVDPRASRST